MIVNDVARYFGLTPINAIQNLHNLIKSTQLSRKSSIHLSRQSLYSDSFSSLRSQSDQSLKTALDLATTRGASAWLSALPLLEYGFSLYKAAFHDAVALRYGWPLQRTPSHCACGAAFSVDHALSCPRVVFLPFAITRLGTSLLVC